MTEKSYYVEEITSCKIARIQKGVIRTNCMDCLDRTNVVQTRIAIRMLDDQLLKLAKGSREAFKEDEAIVNDKIRDIWMINGDMLSRQYSGTSSTISTVTKTGKQGFFGVLKQGMMGIERFFKNNLTDNHK